MLACWWRRGLGEKYDVCFHTEIRCQQFPSFLFQTKVELSAFFVCRGNTENEVKLRKSPATPQELDSLSWMVAKSISRSSFWLFHGVQNRWREGPSRNKTLERRCKRRSSYGAVDRSVEKRSTFKGAKWQRGKMRYQLSAIDGWHSTKSLAVQIALQRKHNRNLSHNSW